MVQKGRKGGKTNERGNAKEVIAQRRRSDSSECKGGWGGSKGGCQRESRDASRCTLSQESTTTIDSMDGALGLPRSCSPVIQE